MKKWADALTGYSVEVQPGQTVVIRGSTAAEPLLLAVYESVIRRGGRPMFMMSPGDALPILLGQGSADQIEFISPFEDFMRREADVVISIIAESNTRQLSGIDPTQQSRYSKARSELTSIFMERESAGTVQWTLTQYPTDAHAQDAEMSTADYGDFIFKACKLHEHDPIAAWQNLARDQQHLVDWLTPRSEIHILAPGTDLKLSTENRRWINCDGRKNFPDGEIFTAPIEDSVEGTVSFSFPAVVSGREVSGVILRFDHGKVVDASADKGEELLISQMNTDEGARRLGEFAFGTNFDVQRFTKSILFDEKIGGTMHMALGEGYPESGSQNVSAIHWDMVCDLRKGGTVTVDGQPFLRDGKFVV